MSARTLDVLILIPLIPALPAIITWWLPWEDWIPQFISKRIIGPYLIYCTFAAWHFKMPTWFILLMGIWGIVVSAMAISEIVERRRSMAAGLIPGGGFIYADGAPALGITTRLADGTPVHAVCPLCNTLFSTEAFDSDRTYPHERKLKEWYLQHFSAVHAGHQEAVSR